MMARLVTAAVLLPLLFVYVHFLPPVYFLGLTMVAAFLGLAEFGRMTALPRPLQAVLFLGGAGLLTAIHSGSGFAPHVLALAVTAIFVTRLFSSPKPSGATRECGAALIGLLYVPGFLGFQLALRERGVETCLVEKIDQVMHILEMQTRSRFIEQDDPGRHTNSPCQRHSFFHASGKFRGFQPFNAPEPHHT